MAKDTGSIARADYASVIKGLTESIPGLMDKGRILEIDPQNQRALEILKGLEGE